MNIRTVAALAAVVVGAGCADSTGPGDMLSPEDAVFVQEMAASVGALGDYLGPALRQLRDRDGDAAANVQCEEMRQLRDQLRERLQDGDAEGAAQAREQLRLAAARMIRAGLGDGALQEMLRENERLMTQVQLRVQDRTHAGQDTASDQAYLRTMTQLQEQARLAEQAGRPDEALELAARVRDQWRIWQNGN
jgi:hypothetical protein